MAKSDEGWANLARYRDESLTRRQREAAFETLVNEQWGYVSRSARTVLDEICDHRPPRGVDIEQITNDAFYVLGMKSGTFDCSPKKYIWGILRVLAHRYKENGNKRADRRALSYETLLAHPTGLDPDSEETILTERQRVSVAIGQLTPALQEVIELHDYQGFEFEEIDKMLGLKSGGARQRHCRARMRLAQLLTSPAPEAKPAGTEDQPPEPEAPELD